MMAIRLERKIDASPDAVWDMLAQPQRWWGEDVILELEKNGAFREPWRDGTGAHLTSGTVILADRPRKVVIRWADEDWDFETEVTIQIAAEGAGSTLALEHIGWDRAPAKKAGQLVAAHREGWSFHLGNLAEVAASGASSA